MNDAYAAYLRSQQWKDVSNRRKQMDNNVCVCCGHSDNLNVHHVNYPTNWNDTSVEQLVTLCHDCHTLIHRIQEEYDKYDDLWANDDYKRSSCYEHFRRRVAKLQAIECWKRNMFHSPDIAKYTRALNDVLAADDTRVEYYMLSQEVFDLMAFAKDCFIANDDPKFNKQKRKSHKNSKTKYKR